MNLDAFNLNSMDTRYSFNLFPPVNPVSLDKTNVFYGAPFEYSGGNTALINIPLQTNVPFDEPLRSQSVLVTPYNQIKYSGCSS